MKLKLIAAAVIAFVPLFANAGSGNAEAGAKKAESCKACHGEGGTKPIQPDYPVIGGQHYDYLVAAITQYKLGKRKNPIMSGQATALKAEDIRDLAAYFSKQPSELKTKY